MKPMRYVKALLITLLASTMGFAQSPSSIGVCGLTLEHDAQLIKRTRAAIDYIDAGLLNRSDEIRYIPIIIHALHRDNGSGGISNQIAETALCNLNEYFADFETDIQFYLVDINHINDTDTYEDHWNQGEGTMLSAKDWSLINVYVPISANFDPNGIFDVAGYYSPGADWIVVGQSNLGGSTLAHEVGHYLSLPHPFRGWDNEPYDPNVHGEQVGPNAPGSFGQNIIPNELQDGSNCSTAGDLICDTPPDYNHFGPSWGCNYNGGAKDPNGELIDPDEHNVMAYFLGCNPKVMSQGQIDVIHADIDLRIHQGNLYELQNPNPGEVGQTATVAPADSAVVQDNSSIYFEWAAVDNAEHYEIWIDWVPTFSLDPIILTTTETNLTYDGTSLIPDKRYFWRVKPVNSFVTCTDFTPNSIFFTTVVSGLKEVDASAQMTVFPNPLSVEDELSLRWDVDSEQMDWKLLDMRGAVLKQSQNSSTQTNISLRQLPTGIYWLKAQSEDQTAIKKIIVY